MSSLSIVTIYSPIGPILELLDLKDTALRQKSKEISIDSTSLALCQKLAEDMLELLYPTLGVGLAAPQVGILWRMILLNVPEEERDKDDPRFFPCVLINPEITKKSVATDSAAESCLSIPHFRANVIRPSVITVQGYNLKGERVIYEGVSGFPARVFQHEIDHLDGVLFTDYIGPQEGKDEGTSARRKAKASIAKLIA